jgi:hypothetical protein
MHVELPIPGGHVLMATDMLESMSHELKIGNNVTINFEPDSREETQRLFDALSEGSTKAVPPLSTRSHPRCRSLPGYPNAAKDAFPIRTTRMQPEPGRPHRALRTDGVYDSRDAFLKG